MRSLLFFIASLIALSANAQVETFEGFPLSKNDTFYVNYSHFGQDVGFDDSITHFPCVYDTSYGYTFWSSGFVYSNKTDSVTIGYTNQFAAKPAKGFNVSNKYAVAYGITTKLIFKPRPGGVNSQGFYITNSTYAYNSMKNGDAFAKKFGGATGNDPDWFKIVARAYRNGQLTADTSVFYLADYRNSANKYIVNTWQWFSLSNLGKADSLLFTLSSTDNGTYGMNTPAYFCMDNFTTSLNTGIKLVNKSNISIYPVPATDVLFIDIPEGSATTLTINDVAGRVLATYNITTPHMKVNIENLPAGNYIIKLNGPQTVSYTFIKQ